MFGYPGGCILNVYDALYKHSDEITHILTSHEQGVSHAADGYARATGKVGVCMATSGPGATNLVTGIATAYMDSIPIIAITCNVAVSLLGRDSFQEIDIAGVTMPITKHNFIVKDVNKLADTVRRAFKIAKEGRPGPVLIDITKDVTANKAEYERKEPEQVKRITDRIKAEDIETAVKMIEASKKPYVFVGGGAIASGADAQLNEFAHKIDSPVADTLMGKGAFNGTDPLYTGMLGMHGTKASNYGVSQCDLLAYQPLISCHMRFYSGYHLTWTEWLCNIVICSQTQTADLVNIFFLCGNHNDRGVFYLTYTAADLKPICSRKHQIQDQQVIFLL